MMDVIGNAAGQIWNVLSQQKSPINVTELSKITNLKSQIVYQALGWLAREGHVKLVQEGEDYTIELRK